MKSLKIKNFKAFRNELEPIRLDGKNLLLYGENGSGKSSLYEALRVVFFKEKLETEIVVAPTPDEQEQLDKDFWAKFKNNNSRASEFEIKINNKSYKTFNKSNYQAFMISINYVLMEKNSIELKQLINEFDFKIENIDGFCESHFNDIEEKVNHNLKKFHENNIIIKIDQEDNYKIKMEDIKRKIEAKENLYNYFNEAKLNLIILLLLFETIKKAEDNTKQRLLVLDDFITSLDIANRTFVIRYILKEFKDFQILLLTHNVHFFNLIYYSINEQDIKKKWALANLFEINHKHKLYFNEPSMTVKELRAEWNTSRNVNEIGNKVRQKSEIIVYELSKILMIGAIEENKEIFTSILDKKNLYFKKEGKKLKDIHNLIDEIIQKINASRKCNLKTELNSLIDEYKSSNYETLKSTMQELKLFKKVILHPMSHGQQGSTSFTTKEINESLNILDKLETNMKKVIHKKFDGA